MLVLYFSTSATEDLSSGCLREARNRSVEQSMAVCATTAYRVYAQWLRIHPLPTLPSLG